MTTDSAHKNQTDSRKPPAGAKRFIPLLGVLTLLVLFIAFGGNDLISLDTFKAQRAFLTGYAAENPFLAPIVMVFIYASLVAISFPGAALLTLFSGFMFGPWLGGAVALTGASLGAIIIFEVAKNSLGALFADRAGPYMAKARAGFQANQLSYMFILRLAPVFPFWVVNLVPALLGVRRSLYITATAFGMAPGTFVYAGIGAGAGTILDAGQDISFGNALLEPSVIIPLLGLILLSLIPMLVKLVRKKHP